MFTAYDYNGVALDNEAIIPDSDFVGIKIFSYADNDSPMQQTTVY